MSYSVKGGKNLDGIYLYFCAIFKYPIKKIVQSSSKQVHSFNIFKEV